LISAQEKNVHIQIIHPSFYLGIKTARGCAKKSVLSKIHAAQGKADTAFSWNHIYDYLFHKFHRKFGRNA
jgi:hypothetical protein